jgi:hypothetical protein
MVIIFSILVCILIGYLFIINYTEKYSGYDYDRENPNALVSGESIAGTVYSSYPEDTPGLGWIL